MALPPQALTLKVLSSDMDLAESIVSFVRLSQDGGRTDFQKISAPHP
jgi:hypothetical protein